MTENSKMAKAQEAISILIKIPIEDVKIKCSKGGFTTLAIEALYNFINKETELPPDDIIVPVNEIAVLEQVLAEIETEIKESKDLSQQRVLRIQASELRQKIRLERGIFS